MADSQTCRTRHQKYNSKKDECGYLSPLAHFQVQYAGFKVPNEPKCGWKMQPEIHILITPAARRIQFEEEISGHPKLTGHQSGPFSETQSSEAA